MGPVLKLVTFIGALFGFLAGILAYIILYGEYIHHFPDSARPRKMALQGAIFAFFVFFVGAIVFGYALQFMTIH